MARPPRLSRPGAYTYAACAAAVTLALTGCTSGGVSDKPVPGPSQSSPSLSGTPTPTPTATATTPVAPGSPTAPTPTTSRPTPPATTGGSPRTVSLSFSANGTSVHLAVGEHLHLALPTPHWTFHRPDAPRVLRQDAAGVATPTATCSGPAATAGCGTSTADFTATGPGSTTVVATRLVCGEAMRCTGSSSRFVIHAVVN